MTLNDDVKKKTIEAFLFDMVSRMTLYTNQYRENLSWLSSEVIQYDDCTKKIKTYQNLIQQFEKTPGREKMLDKLYPEFILLTAAYQHAMFMKHVDLEARN